MMPPVLLRLAAELLDLASREFSNHGCNDFKMTGRFDDTTLATLADLMNRQNLGDDYATEYAADEDDIETVENLRDYAADWCLMTAMAHGLREMADDAEAAAVMPGVGVP